MQPLPNRMGLGMRPTPYGQGPSMSALAQQQHMHPQFINAQAVRTTTLFVGSISGGITDQHLNEMLGACGPLNSFKRLITPANKPQGFGFAEFQDPDGAIRALKLLNGVELPALEDGCANKKLLVKADEKTSAFINAYQAQRAPTDADNKMMEDAKFKIDQVVTALNQASASSVEGGGEKERYVIPPHLHDLQEAELPEAQRGLVISEIALFRERAAKREREKLKDERERGMAFGITTAFNTPSRGNGPAPSPKGPANAPSGPKERSWGRGQGQGQQQQISPRQQSGYGSGAQGYNKPVGFVQSQGEVPGETSKTDEQREQDRKDARARDENESFRDRERRYEPRERQRIMNLERAIQRERLQKEAEERDKIEMHSRLDIWDDDESDELFYTDRARWRSARRRHLAQEEAADRASRELEATEAEHLRRESEAFLARQMEDMRSLAEEQRKAGLLLDDGAPVKLNVSLAPAPTTKAGESVAPVPVFGQEEEEEGIRKRKASLIKLDFSATESGEKARQRLEKIRDSVPTDKETLWKVKVRWDAVNEQLVDRKLEPVIKRKMTEYLGELEDDDLIMFVVEHLKDKKGPQKLVEGLEPVLEEEAEDFVVALWRQVTFESMAYGEGLDSGKMLVI